MEFKLLYDTNEGIKKLRYDAFVIERSVPEEIEFDGKDSEFLHFTLWEGEEVVACLRANSISSGTLRSITKASYLNFFIPSFVS